jgi:hypothetical protein
MLNNSSGLISGEIWYCELEKRSFAEVHLIDGNFRVIDSVSLDCTGSLETSEFQDYFSEIGALLLRFSQTFNVSYVIITF